MAHPFICHCRSQKGCRQRHSHMQSRRTIPIHLSTSIHVMSARKFASQIRHIPLAGGVEIGKFLSPFLVFIAAQWYLRKAFFALSHELRYTNMWPPLDAAHLACNHEWTEFRDILSHIVCSSGNFHCVI